MTFPGQSVTNMPPTFIPTMGATPMPAMAIEWECQGCGRIVPQPALAGPGLGKCVCGIASWASPPRGKAFGRCPTCHGPLPHQEVTR